MADAMASRVCNSIETVEVSDLIYFHSRKMQGARHIPLPCYRRKCSLVTVLKIDFHKIYIQRHILERPTNDGNEHGNCTTL